MELDLKAISSNELSKRDGKQLPEIWIAYNGLIYDVTDSKLFVGGKHYRHNTGIDLTTELQQAPHTDRVFEKFKPIGRLVD